MTTEAENHGGQTVGQSLVQGYPGPSPAGRDTCPGDFLAAVQDDRAPVFYQALHDRWIWQDQLMWSRTQLLLVIQGATIAATAALRETTPLGLGSLLFLAGFLSLALYRLATLDERNRNNTGSLLNAIILTNMPTDTPARRRNLRYLLGSGGGLIRVIIGAFAALDFILGSYILVSAIDT